MNLIRRRSQNEGCFCNGLWFIPSAVVLQNTYSLNCTQTIRWRLEDVYVCVDRSVVKRAPIWRLMIDVEEQYLYVEQIEWNGPTTRNVIHSQSFVLHLIVALFFGAIYIIDVSLLFWLQYRLFNAFVGIWLGHAHILQCHCSFNYPDMHRNVVLLMNSALKSKLNLPTQQGNRWEPTALLSNFMQNSTQI